MSKRSIPIRTAWVALQSAVAPCSNYCARGASLGGALLPLDIPLGFCFFFLAFKAQYALIDAASLLMRAWTCASRQSMGSMLVVAFASAWTAGPMRCTC